MISKEEIIAANDALRTTFKGGTVLMTPSVYDLPGTLRGRALYRLTLYQTFDAESDHSQGVFIFAGLTFIWTIGEFANERSITLSLAEDW